MWTGDYLYLLRQLVLKDFKIRYRNMSLGVFWSLLNPLVLMGIYTFVFTRIFTNPIPHFNIHILCGIIPFNFFAMSWSASTTSLLDSAFLVKRIPIRREIVPIAAVLSNLTHLVIQLGLLVLFIVASGIGFNWNWIWLPVVWGLELMFLVGLGLVSSALNLFVRDVRYVVESSTLVLFWIVPIVYSFEMVPQDLSGVYQYNPVAALVLATHNIILKGQPPSSVLLTKLAVVSVVALIVGLEVFRKLERRFYQYL